MLDYRPLAAVWNPRPTKRSRAASNELPTKFAPTRSARRLGTKLTPRDMVPIVRYLGPLVSKRNTRKQTMLWRIRFRRQS